MRQFNPLLVTLSSLGIPTPIQQLKFAASYLDSLSRQNRQQQSEVQVQAHTQIYFHLIKQLLRYCLYLYSNSVSHKHIKWFAKPYYQHIYRKRAVIQVFLKELSPEF